MIPAVRHRVEAMMVRVVGQGRGRNRRYRPAAWLATLRLWLLMAFVSALANVGAHAQVGFDRPGGDYTSFIVKPADPTQCASRCEHDSHCHAWSFSYPITENTNALCWLKSEVPARVPAPCCVSGVRGAAVVEPRSGAVEFAIDRPGGDYRSFELQPDPTGATCRTACDAEARCRAWTYVRPGYVNPAAQCVLKDHIKPPHRRPCCISGVVR
jgi:PAN domain-containing protein